MVNLVWLLAQASENATASSPEDQISQWVNAFPLIAWSFAILLFVGGVIQSIDSVRDWSSSFLKKLGLKKREITDEQRQNLRRQLIDIALREVVKRLEDSLHHKIRLDLKRKEQRERVGRRDLTPVDDFESSDQFIRREFNPFDSPSPATPIASGISTYDLLARDDIQGRLLILGEPGSGKTNELLAVAKALLQTAQQSTDQPIPIIFELSEWSSDREKSFSDWLSEQLKGRYNVSPDLSKHWIEQNQLFPLLDGLDELRRIDNVKTATSEEVDRRRLVTQVLYMQTIFELSERSNDHEEPFVDWLREQLNEKYDFSFDGLQQWIEQNQQSFPFLDYLGELHLVNGKDITSEEVDQQRQAKQIRCMRAINEFLDVNPSISMVVSCRRQEYETLQAQGEYLKRLNGAIYLQELDDAQIQRYFKDSNRGPLWDTLRNQPKLLELTRSPLFLLMFVVAYQGQPIQTTDELLDLYIEKQFNDLNNQGAYPPGKSLFTEKTHHYLSWLATKLEEQSVIEFLIEGLQPSWLDREKDLNRYTALVKLSFVLIVGLSGGLFFGLAGIILSGRLFGLMFGLSGVLSFGCAGGLICDQIRELNRIQPIENLSFLWKDMLRSGLIGGLFFGLLGMLLGMLLGILIDKLVFESIDGPDGWLFLGLLFGLFAGLGSGLIFGLCSGLLISESDIGEKQSPNQGIKKSIMTSLMFGLIFGLLGGLIFGLLGGLIFGLLSGLIFGLLGGLLGGLVGGLMFGLFAVIQHTSLRFILHRSGVAPWNYARFLEHAENHRFIQRTGGRYRFVHALLRKRFAERYQPRYR